MLTASFFYNAFMVPTVLLCCYLAVFMRMLNLSRSRWCIISCVHYVIYIPNILMYMHLYKVCVYIINGNIAFV